MTKITHFIPYSKSTTAPEFGQLFIFYVIRLHVLSDLIVLDRDSIFTSNFWFTLTSILKIDPGKSTAFHP